MRVGSDISVPSPVALPDDRTAVAKCSRCAYGRRAAEPIPKGESVAIMTDSCTDTNARRQRAYLAAVVAITALAASLIGGAEAQANGDDLRVSPRVGTPTTTFRVTFTAPFRTNGVSTDYTLEGVGPRSCPSLFEFTLRPTRRGDRVVMRLTAFDDLFLGVRRRWCRGSYVGYVYFSAPLRDVLIGYFSFGVGRSPVSLEG